jgi:uncharacterized protein GlcG (DUF336 family)
MASRDRAAGHADTPPPAAHPAPGGGTERPRPIPTNPNRFTRTMSTLTLALAQQVIAGALAAARQHGFKPMGVVVVDAAAQPVASAREDGASALRLDIALGKAASAVGMGVNSRVLAVRSKDVPVFFSAVAAVAREPFIPQTGAVLITDGNGRVIGAAGASGGTGDEDEQIVLAGIAAAGLAHG